jgi:hypothetical protein
MVALARHHLLQVQALRGLVVVAAELIQEQSLLLHRLEAQAVVALERLEITPQPLEP